MNLVEARARVQTEDHSRAQRWDRIEDAFRALGKAMVQVADPSYIHEDYHPPYSFWRHVVQVGPSGMSLEDWGCDPGSHDLSEYRANDNALLSIADACQKFWDRLNPGGPNLVNNFRAAVTAY